MEFKAIGIIERRLSGNKIKYMVPERAVFEKMVQGRWHRQRQARRDRPGGHEPV